MLIETVGNQNSRQVPNATNGGEHEVSEYDEDEEDDSDDEDDDDEIESEDPDDFSDDDVTLSDDDESGERVSSFNGEARLVDMYCSLLNKPINRHDPYSCSLANHCQKSRSNTLWLEKEPLDEPSILPRRIGNDPTHPTMSPWIDGW